MFSNPNIFGTSSAAKDPRPNVTRLRSPHKKMQSQWGLISDSKESHKIQFQRFHPKVAIKRATWDQRPTFWRKCKSFFLLECLSIHALFATVEIWEKKVLGIFKVIKAKGGNWRKLVTNYACTGVEPTMDDLTQWASSIIICIHLHPTVYWCTYLTVHDCYSYSRLLSLLLP